MKNKLSGLDKSVLENRVVEITKSDKIEDSKRNKKFKVSVNLYDIVENSSYTNCILETLIKYSNWYNKANVEPEKISIYLEKLILNNAKIVIKRLSKLSNFIKLSIIIDNKEKYKYVGNSVQEVISLVKDFKIVCKNNM